MAPKPRPGAPKRAGRPSYNLTEDGFLVPADRSEERIIKQPDGEAVVQKLRIRGWKCAYCEWEHFLRGANINTTRALDHLILKCKAIPEDRKAALLEGEAGAGATWKRQREAALRDAATELQENPDSGPSSPDSPSPYNSPTPSDTGDGAGPSSDYPMPMERARSEGKGKAPMDPADVMGLPGLGPSGMPHDTRQPPMLPMGFPGPVPPPIPGMPPWPFDFRIPPPHMPLPPGPGPLPPGYGPSTSGHHHLHHHHPPHPGPSSLQQQDAALNRAIATFVVGCGLPFSVTEHPLFVKMMRYLRPDFVKLMRPSHWFSMQGLQELYYDTRSRIEQMLSSSLPRQFISLQSTTFQTSSGLTVLNFTECQDRKSVYKDTVAIGDTEQEHTLVSIFAQQLATRGPDRWCSLVIEDTCYLSNVLSILEANFKGIQCYGCAAYQLEQLCEDYARDFRETLLDAQFVISYVMTNRDLYVMLKRIQGRFGIKLRHMPEIKPLKAVKMLKSLLANQSHMRAMMGDPQWNECSRSAKGPPQNETSRFVSLVGSIEFWNRVSTTSKLMSPVTTCADMMNSPSSRLSHVYMLFNKLSQDINDWCEKCGSTPVSAKVLKSWEKRWKGEGQQGGLFHPVHLAAFLLDPYMTIHCEALPQHAMRTMKGVFSKYVSSEHELSNLMEAFYLYHSRGDIYLEPFEECNSHVLAKYDKLKEEFLSKESLSDFSCFSQSTILKCRAAGDPVAWWKMHGHDTVLKSVAIRILSAQPVASCSAQISAMGRIVQHVPNAEALQLERVKMLLYSNINLQLLYQVSPEAESMAEEALMEAVIAAT